MNNYKDFVVVNITLNATIPWIHPHHFGDHGKRKKAAEAKICSEQQDDKDAALEDVAETEEKVLKCPTFYETTFYWKIPQKC